MLKKENKKISLGTVVIGAMFLFMAIPAFTNGQTWNEIDAAARAEYFKAKDTYSKEVDFYKQSREDFLTARQKYQQYKNAPNKAELETKAKKFLNNAMSVAVRRLEALRNKAANVRGVSDADRQMILTEIDSDISWLKEKQSLLPAATPQQIKDQAKIALEHWDKIRVTAKRISGQLLAARIDFTIGKAETLALELDKEITALKALGKDTAKLEQWLSDFRQKIMLAKEKYQLAQERFKAINSLATADKLFTEGHQFIKQANQYVIEAYKSLKEIIKEMKLQSVLNPGIGTIFGVNSTSTPEK